MSIRRNEPGDTLNVLNLDEWSSNVISHIKTPLQSNIFTNNSDTIGKTLRRAIIYFAETLNEIDRPSCVIGNEFRSTRTHKYTLSRPSDDKTSNATMSILITTYAPIAFDHARSAIGITRNNFHSSFSNGELINFANTGRSGSQMYKTYDDIYIIKTLRDHEAKYLMRILSGFYFRYSYAPSLLTRYVGLYSVNVSSMLSSEIYCVVMLNNLPSFLNIHELFDLKGSTIGRQSSIDIPSKRLKALKDNDFELFYPHGILIPHEIYRKLKSTLESDIYELKKLLITDYSLMLGIHHLDEPNQNQNNDQNTPNGSLKPQLGISAFYFRLSIDESNEKPDDPGKMKNSSNFLNTHATNKFIMKPLHLIACPQQNTFKNSEIASSLLGIPGVTPDGRRVLIYPAFIDCLQTFDSFKRIQSTIQNIQDPKRTLQYSVINPDDYEKRLSKFLFGKVFINSHRTLDQLLASPGVEDYSTVF